VGGRHYSAAAQTQLREILGTQLAGIKDAGTFKAERIITSSQSTQITVQGSDKKILNFCANNYLGLAVSELVAIPVMSTYELSLTPPEQSGDRGAQPEGVGAVWRWSELSAFHLRHAGYTQAAGKEDSPVPWARGYHSVRLLFRRQCRYL